MRISKYLVSGALTLGLVSAAWAVSQTTITVKDGAGSSQTVNTTPSVGAAGTPSTDVVTVQGCASCTASPLPTGASTSANQTSELTKLDTIITNTGAAIPAGSAIIGNVRIDQTTPGTTNAVQDAATSATAAAVPSKAILTGARSGANIVEVIQADTSVALTMSTATTTQFVALSSGKKIYVTALDVIAAGTTNVTFVYGTGSNCGTGTTSLTGVYNLTAQTGLTKGSGLGPVLVIPASQALCVTNSAAVTISGSIAYTQF